MSEFPETLFKAYLVKRINRFVAEVIFNNISINVYVPNTGRLSELALPGAELLLSPITTKYKFKILYIINRSFPVMIDSTYSNRLFYELLVENKVPGLSQYSSIKREPVYENHRFDFHLSSDHEETYIELKSCSLFHNKTGSFPDAVSSRASEHVKALAESGKGKLIFFVLRGDIEIFLPNYHTDFIFYETLKHYKNEIEIAAYTVQYGDNLKIKSLKKIPVVIPDVKPEGIYLLVLFNPSDTVNSDGKIIKQGFYIYCGEDDNNIFKTISLIKRKNGLNIIIPDIQSAKWKIISDLPVITSSITTAMMINKLIIHCSSDISSEKQKNYYSDKDLLYFKKNPMEESWFWDIILEMRFGKYS